MALVVPAEIWSLIFADCDHVLVTSLSRVCRGAATAALLYHGVWNLHTRVYWHIDGDDRVLCSVDGEGRPRGWLVWYHDGTLMADFYFVEPESTCQQMMLLAPHRIYLIDLGNCLHFPNMPEEYRVLSNELHQAQYSSPDRLCQRFLQCVRLASEHAEDDARWVCTNSHFMTVDDSDSEPDD